MVLKKSEPEEHRHRCRVAGEMCRERPDCSNKVLVVPEGEGCKCVTSQPEVTHLFPTLRTMQENAAKHASDQSIEDPTVLCASKEVLTYSHNDQAYAKSASVFPRALVQSAKTREEKETGLLRAHWNMSRDSGKNSDDRLTNVVTFKKNYIDLIKTLMPKHPKNHKLIQPNEKFVPDNWGIIPSYERNSPVLSM